MVNIDKQLVELRKVSGESTSVIQDFSVTATEMALNLGKSSEEIIAATVEFSRLGLSIEQANIMAENSLLLSNVGNMELSQASKHLISTMKAFRVEIDAEGSNIKQIVDLINETGNNFAISQEGIGEALRRSSAGMAAANNTMEETIALKCDWGYVA